MMISRRIPSIESFRVLAIFGVILWHTDLLVKLRQFAGGFCSWKLSLPYFFIAAGYFFSKSAKYVMAIELVR